MSVEELRPTKRLAVLDLVTEAGIDTRPWHKTKKGRIVKYPKANPSYCYNWSFGGFGEPIAVCIWHKGISVNNDEIFSKGNLRKLGDQLQRQSEDEALPRGQRTSAGVKARRAYAFDAQIHEAFLRRESVRAIILEGKGDRVDFRRLDNEPWHVATYGDTGQYLLVRGANRRTQDPVLVFVDQFSCQDNVRRRELNGSTFERSTVIRGKVLARANGKCEYCDERGFKTDKGELYLETHHIIPLSEGGADNEFNVIAICANDHRRAHSGEGRIELRQELQARLQSPTKSRIKRNP